MLDSMVHLARGLFTMASCFSEQLAESSKSLYISAIDFGSTVISTKGIQSETFLAGYPVINVTDGLEMLQMDWRYPITSPFTLQTCYVLCECNFTSLASPVGSDR